jgi:uncharacterized membrane protein YiaA
MKPSKKLIPHVAIIVVVGIGLFLTRNWPYETALFPRFGCIAVLVVAILSFISELVRKRERGEEQKDLRRTGIIFGWLVVFVIGVWAFGYECAALAFVFFFMKIHGRLSWKTSIAFSSFSFLFLLSVYRLLLDMTWPHGALWEMFGF